jgi:hypothetical protein
VRTRLPVVFWKSGAEFTPAEIPGLALWLDASDGETLYTTDAGPVTAVSSPTEIAGCVGWWDASDAGSITESGGLVSQWNDKSTAGNHATASSTARPTTGTRSLNGRNVLDFDGTANAMATSLADAATQTVLFVAVSDVASSSGRLWSYGTTNRGVFSDSGTWAFWRQQTSGAILFGATASATSPSVACALFTSNSSLTTFGSGAQGTTNDPVDSSGASFNIGKETTNFFNGYIAEIVIYNTALTTAQRASVEAYLAAKWSISGVHAPATATSDPVGAWLDKSGNARHATQSTAGNRPTVGSSSTAGKNAVRNNGTGSVALQVAAWPYTAGNTQFAVFNASAINQGIIQRGSLNDEPRMAIQTGANGVAAIRGTRGGSVLTQTHSEVGYALSQWAIGATLFNTSLGRTYRDGVYGTDTTDSQPFSGDQELRLLSLPSNIYGINGGIAELLYYDRQLTATEVTRVARYLSSRWGITLAPQVSNADAQDWINRVYANGGQVSAATAASVNTLCDSLDAASLRDRFYRLNLFCGSNLNAALVPLYRGPSLGGTQYGNATDTNVGPFVTGDYNETGVSGGLNSGASNSSKYLRTGIAPSDMSAVCTNVHASVYSRAVMSSNSQAIGANAFSFFPAYGGTRVFFRTNGNNSGLEGTITTTSGHILAVRTGAAAADLYRNGSSQGGTPADNGTTASETSKLLVFGTGGAETASVFFPGTLQMYSLGLGMTATQAAAFYSAVQAFQTSLTRNL